MKNLISPEEQYGPLFLALHASRLWSDGKMLSDALPLASPEEINAAYAEQKDTPAFDLKAFFETYFRPNPSRSTTFKSDLTKSVEEHIARLWPVLTCERDQDLPGSSLIPLPHPYIVPGGRFNEIYYWDSYFTQLGLQESKQVELIQHMVDNFTHLINTLGFIPNGNRSYFISRSQPPFYALMLDILAEEKGEEIYAQYLTALEKEYRFWMEDGKAPDAAVYGHRVTTPLGTLNRYYDKKTSPRAEMYQTDLDDAQKTTRPAEELFANIRAACESGWDFSSRWFKDPNDLASIRTLELLPVDLNCLLYHLEFTLAKAHKVNDSNEQSSYYASKANQRKQLIVQQFWDPQTAFFHDLEHSTMRPTPSLHLGGLFPLFFGIATPAQAQAVAQKVEMSFLKAGGLVTTLETTGQQWDAPNGWAPLQWIGIRGLERYGYHDLANTIAQRWTQLNTRVYQRTGRLLEKYNVVNIDHPTGGGEYAVQDGFGWTNGVLLKLLKQR